jgi:hypothetical protein
MKKTLTTLIALFVSGSFIYGQFGLFGSSSIKLIEKGEFADAEKKINKDLTKTPDDIETNYAMSLLFLKRAYTGYNTEKSYEYLMRCKKLFGNVTEERELNKLNKIPLTQVVFQNYIDTVCRCAMEDDFAKNDINLYQKYLDYYLTAPENYRKQITEKRNAEAYKIASEKNTTESYDHFISGYPDAIQNADAVLKRNISAYQKAETTDNIDAYKDFILKYPDATQVGIAWDRIHELAFNQAEKENKSASYKKFIDEYPNCKQYPLAFSSYEKKLYDETVVTGDWTKYRLFIDKYPGNSLKHIAQDSIYAIGARTENLEILKYCLDNFMGIRRDNTLLLYHDIFTEDGEKVTLDIFYSKYQDDMLNQVKQKDYEIAILGEELMLYMPYKTSDFTKYDQYIRLAAPRNMAFFALQKMISPDIDAKNNQLAITKILTYISLFGTKNKKLLDLISFLETK